jgi:hypothetical protein
MTLEFPRSMYVAFRAIIIAAIALLIGGAIALVMVLV